MRWGLAAALAGCTAQAAPPLSGGGSPPSSATGMAPTVDSTLAQCQALTPAEGDLCFPTDSPYTMVARVAGTWSYRYPGVGFDVTPPPSTGWTAYNSGSVAVVGGTRVLTMPAETTAGGWRGEYRTRPSDPTVTPYTCTAVLVTSYAGNSGGSGGYGIGFTDATGWAFAYGTHQYATQRNSNATTFVANDSVIDSHTGLAMHHKFWEDASLRHFALCSNASATAGAICNESGSGYTRTTTITATGVGWIAIGSDAEMPRSVALVHWSCGAS